MKQYYLVIVVLVTLLQACSSIPALELKNEMNLARKDAPVVLNRVLVAKAVGQIPSDKIPVVIDDAGNYIPSQVDDLDGDGQWDELVFVCDMSANELKSVNLNFLAPDKVPAFTDRTNVRLGVGSIDEGFKGTDQAVSPEGYTGVPVIFQAESVSWENDIMAFRNYFDCRNAKDLFGKLSPEMVMNKIGTKEVGSYHHLSDWGMDVLHVGPSLGAGGLALFHQDSLYRLGNVKSFEFQLVSRGPVRSIFELNFDGWDVDGKKLKAQEKITVWAGKYWFQSDVTVTGLDNEAELAIGIVTSYLKDSKPFKIVANREYTAVATHDIQSMNKDYLGMGILLSTDSKLRTGDAPLLSEKRMKGSRYNMPVGETHFVTQKIKNNQSARHYFFAAWEVENKDWSKQINFENLMKSQSEELSSPVRVIVK
ncbi:DUF4861 domain-containing protein [Ancylomarina euxinus]|uniref:DUF4861 domain-containing protein n=1 Tax=Ancylomarina euxinus TaxID=2283627 RepID=A0A425XZ63_9BACT|nr:DUF4861 domain-containing protein [Ancylomarina euxinus]MCZ4694767.1 DUF4861 domain-containing protein [Ancylomarina euxinus]MUP15841.1 DUF4861 domain-containing protein [Ancylomarina euxinus]RRG20481.1 DUF4861 domain-containing protein [Ancylomarina euxinus]